MTKFYICGQAPSRIGDGRPFNGPSGRRLAVLSGVMDYEQLHEQVGLMNIFDRPAEKRLDRGDEFDRDAARERGRELIEVWKSVDEKGVVVACGHAVFHALTGIKGTFYRGKRFGNVEVWCFPHPSGASGYWNYQANVRLAANFLRRLLASRGIALIDDEGAPIPID